jgi:dsDNA-binding SOS-regulon protein
MMGICMKCGGSEGHTHSCKLYKYYTIDMAGHKKYFKNKKEADEWRKFIHDHTANWLYLYKVKQVL